MQNLVDTSVDSERPSHYLTEFQARHPDVLNQLEADDERFEWLLTIFAFSRFLSEELLQHPNWLLDISEMHRALPVADYKEHLSAFLKQRAVASPTALDLALFRRKELLRLVVRDALGFGSLSEITEELSDLADAILERALEKVRSEIAARHGSPLIEDASGVTVPAAFTVLALGKLGGRELNYSSDIDLMFLYTGNGETSGPEKITNKEFFKKVANQFTGLLSTYTAAGVCYRVDLRLRPEGSLGDVCISLAGAQEYYSKRARDWELQMLIKARVTAGDEALGQALLDFVEPSIYSTTLDFSTIETMSATRERISEKLTRKRLRKDELDVKLAPGGIRDIEFLVQCLQRLHGARETCVRHGGTLAALSNLLAKDLLSATEHSRLGDAYKFLRHLEHRLQFEEDRQTHALPAKQEALERLGRRMPRVSSGNEPGVSSFAQLLQELNRHLENVQIIYDRIVHAQRPLSYSFSPPANSGPEAPPRPADERGSLGLSKDLLRSLDDSAPKLAQRFREHSVYRSDRALAFFLEGLLQHPPYLQLLNGHLVLADYAIQMFEVSPFFSEQLTRYPELLEEIGRLADHPTRRRAFEGLAAPLNDINGLRRFFRREMFRIQAGSVCLPESVFQTLDRTSALAEFVIARAYRIGLEQAIAHARGHATQAKPFEEPKNEMMLVALGRLGMREFDLGSDADLLFIVPDTEAHRQRFWTRVAEHVIEILTTYTGDGTILSLDTRLRPNGREGMLVQTESKYVDYFANRAEAWEGIAYMKARGVAGDIERATVFLTELQHVDWRRYGQGGRSKKDLYQMRMRLQREEGTLSPLKAGHGGYYDADFILMYLRLKGAGMFFKSLNTPERIDVVEKMGHLERADAEFLLEATTFLRALEHGLRIVLGRAEEKLPGSHVEQEMLADLMHRWTGEYRSASALQTELQTLQDKMRHLFERIFAH
ncbi:MAG: glutamine-synthetase adenylyltransferase [Bryobacteraceae bacterium]